MDPAGMIQVKVRLFGPAADVVGTDEMEYGLAPPARLADLLELLYIKYPSLAARARLLRFAINEQYAEPESLLTTGDEVAIIPPVAGGEEPAWVQLVNEPIAADKWRVRLADVSCGAVAGFEGIVRAHGTTDNPLLALEYSAYEPMAFKQLCCIREEALERFDVRHVAIVHRLGRLEIGEISVLILVASPHRAAAFEACQWILETLKVDVPIFKKEIWSQGHTSWVEPKP